MNTYIAIRPYIAQQVVEQLKKLKYNEVSGIINEIVDSMNYPVRLNWNQPVDEGENKEEQKRPIGFRCVEEEVEGDDDGEGEPDEPTIVCKPKGKGKGKIITN